MYRKTQAIASEFDLIHWTCTGMGLIRWNSQLFAVLKYKYEINMYTEPMIVAVSKEIKAPMYIDL